MSHPYEKPSPWDGYRSVVPPMTEEQKARLLELREKASEVQQDFIDALLEQRTHEGAIVREGLLNRDNAQALIEILEREVGE